MTYRELRDTLNSCDTGILDTQIVLTTQNRDDEEHTPLDLSISGYGRAEFSYDLEAELDPFWTPEVAR